MNSEESKKIDVINALRGYAILAVIYQHLFGQLTPPGWVTINIGDIVWHPLTFLSNGWLGVNLFFVLSGFVLFLPYVKNTRAMNSPQSIMFYYQRRANRLLPLYYIVVLFLLVTTYKEADDYYQAAVSLLTITFNFSAATFSPAINPALWSLGIEILFSLLFPLLVIIFYRQGIFRLFFGVLLFSLFIRYIGISFECFEFGNAYVNAFKDSLPGRLDDFVLGMLICYLYFNNQKFCFRSPYLNLLTGLFFMFLACSLWDYKIAGLLSPNAVPVLNNVLHIGLYFLIISLLHMKNGLLKTMINNYAVQLAGMMCYSLYLLHLIVAWGLPFPDNHIIGLITYFVYLFVICFLTYRYIEFGKERDIKKLLPQK